MAKIAMLVSNRHDPDPRVQKEAEALVKAGNSVCIYAYDRLHEINIENEMINGVEIYRIRTQLVPYGKIWKTGKGLREFRSIVKKKLLESPVDIVHCHDQDTCSVGLWWKKKEKVSLYLMLMIYIDMIPSKPNSIIRKFGALLLRRRIKICKKCDLLIVATGKIGEKNGYQEIYDNWRKNSVVIFNAENDYSNTWSYPEKFTIGYFGNLRDYNMFKTLIDAILLIDEKERPHLRIAGSGAASKEISKLFEKYPEIKCKISGRYNHSELKSLMDECTLQYCLYSRKRGNEYGPKIIFRSFVGKTIVSNSLASEICKQNNWGWKTENIDEISKLIENLVKNGILF